MFVEIDIGYDWTSPVIYDFTEEQYRELSSVLKKAVEAYMANTSQDDLCWLNSKGFIFNEREKHLMQQWFCNNAHAKLIQITGIKVEAL